MSLGEPPRPIDPGVRLGHVHLKVSDLERSLRFYCGVLGFGLTHRRGYLFDAVVLTLSDGHAVEVSGLARRDAAEVTRAVRRGVERDRELRRLRAEQARRRRDAEEVIRRRRAAELEREQQERLWRDAGAEVRRRQAAERQRAAEAERERAATTARRRQVEERVRDFLRTRWPEYEEAVAAFDALSTADRYLTQAEVSGWRQRFGAIRIPEFVRSDPSLLTRDQDRLLCRLRRLLDDPTGQFAARNDRFVAAELAARSEFFDRVERRPLTADQRRAVVIDDGNNLVLAGAGTGKTSTLVARVGYLVDRRLATPDRILLLAFTRKAAGELRQRVRDRVGVDLAVRTFHALGREIIGRAEGRAPRLAPWAGDERAKVRLIAGLLDRVLAGDEHAREGYERFVASDGVTARTAFEFASLEEYQAYLWAERRAHRALTGELVKSSEELVIANWLYLNGVRFRYEAPYPVPTATPTRRQYQPDFTIDGPAGPIYLEHFALDERGEPPPVFNRTPYLDGVAWKRALHAEHGTALVETYSWEARKGTLLDRLSRELDDRNVPRSPPPPAERLRRINEMGRGDTVTDLVATFLTLFRGSNLSLDAVAGFPAGRHEACRAEAFFRFFRPVLERYEEETFGSGQMDFEDLITRAAGHVRTGRFPSPYTHVLIDEFQDISRARADLVLALRDRVPGCKLFCVGDDWQSIYRFAGGDVSLTTRFEDVFGPATRSVLGTTFRSCEPIIDVGTRFVLRNPSQTPRRLTSTTRAEGPGVVVVYAPAADEPDLVGGLLAEIGRASPRAHVLVLARYNRCLTSLCRVSQRLGDSGLTVEFLTAHAAKGLEADYAIVIGLRAGRFGFPSGVTDDPLVGRVLAAPEPFPHAEERRLFYVAITRARTRVYLLADADTPSPFAGEVAADTAVECRGRPTAPVLCPACSVGFLVPRTGSRGTFFACEFRAACGHTEDPCPACGGGPVRMRVAGGGPTGVCSQCESASEVCPACRVGYLVMREGWAGSFVGCSQYRRRSCRYTQPF